MVSFGGFINLYDNEKMKKEDLSIGQEIFLKPIGNAGRRSSEIKKSVIEFIGSKYFEVKDFRNRFKISDGLEDQGQYNSDYQSYLSMQEISDEKELQKGIENIKRNAYRLSLEQVRAVLANYGTKKDL